MSKQDEQSIALQSIAKWYLISGFVVAALSIILMFVDRPCLDYGYFDKCLERGGFNYLYLLSALVAIGQAFIISTLLESGARIIDYLKGIYDIMNAKQQQVSDITKPELTSVHNEAGNYKWDAESQSVIKTKKKMDDDFRLPPID